MLKRIYSLLVLVTIFFVAACENASNDTEKYVVNFKSTFNKIESSKAEDTEMIDSYGNTWANSLNDPMLGKYNSVVAASVAEVYNKYNKEGKIKQSKSNQEEIEQSISKLSNPPEEFQEAYNSLKELQGAAKEISKLATEIKVGNGQGAYFLEYQKSIDNNFNDYKILKNKIDVLIATAQKK